MNCLKCNSPINDGDKFCQACGSFLNTQQQPNVVQPVMNQNQLHQPVNQMGMNPKKKNNALVYVLVSIIVILVIAVVILFINTSKEKEDEENNNNEIVEKEENEENQEEPPVEEDEPIVSGGNTINGFTFNLPSGYIAMDQSGEAAFTDTSSSFIGIVTAMGGNLDLFTGEALKEQLEIGGYTNIKYDEKTINGKRMLVYSFKTSGLDTEIVYYNHSSSVILIASVVYVVPPTSTKQAEIHNIIANVQVDSSALSSNSDKAETKVFK